MSAAICRIRSFSNPSVQAIVSQHRYASSDVSENEERKFPKVSSDLSNMRQGTGGRSSFNGKVATVFGAGGFLGQAVVNQLAKNGTQVVIPYRTDPYNVNHMKVCGDLGQILFSHFNLKDKDSLYKAMKHSNVVINLLGRFYPTPNFQLEDVNVTGAREIARIAKELGIPTLVHVSALNACEKPKPFLLKKGSEFLKTKWRGEQAVREEFPEAIIFRPSDIWGQGDHFLNYFFDNFRRTWRILSLYNKGVGAIKQPVFYSDVAKGILKAISDPDAVGRVFQAVGPHRYEFSELMDWFHRITRRMEDKPKYRQELRFDVTLWLRVLYSEVFLSRYRTLSWERLELENHTDVVLPNLPTLADLGITLTPLEERIFFELKIYRLYGYRDPLLQDYIKPVRPCPFATA